MATETLIDQFERGGTVAEAMEQFAGSHFGEPRQIVRKSVSPDGRGGTLFRLKDGLRTYRIENERGVWKITLVEPAP